MSSTTPDNAKTSTNNAAETWVRSDSTGDSHLSFLSGSRQIKFEIAPMWADFLKDNTGNSCTEGDFSCGPTDTLMARLPQSATSKQFEAMSLGMARYQVREAHLAEDAAGEAAEQTEEADEDGTVGAK